MHMSKCPLGGSKTQLWEGGIKGAAFIYSPLFFNSSYNFQTNYSFNGLMHVTDWYLTIDSLITYFNNVDSSDSIHMTSNVDIDINGMDMFSHMFKALKQTVIHQEHKH